MTEFTKLMYLNEAGITMSVQADPELVENLKREVGQALGLRLNEPAKAVIFEGWIPELGTIKRAIPCPEAAKPGVIQATFDQLIMDTTAALLVERHGLKAVPYGEDADTEPKGYLVSVVFDASHPARAMAKSAKEAGEKALEGAGGLSLCHECSHRLEVGDPIKALVMDEEGNELLTVEV